MSKPWGWDLNEMKDAGSGLGEETASTREAAEIWQPVMSAVTPINRQEDVKGQQTATTQDSEQAEKTSTSKPSKKGQPRKRKQNQASEAKTAPKKPTKRSTAAKAKPTRKQVDAVSQDISQEFKITKPGATGPRSFPQSDDTFQWQLNSQLSAASQHEDSPKSALEAVSKSTWTTPVGLGQTYQSAYGQRPSPKPALTDNHAETTNSGLGHETSGHATPDDDPDDGACAETLLDQRIEPVGDRTRLRSVEDQMKPIQTCLVTDEEEPIAPDAVSRGPKASLSDRLHKEDTSLLHRDDTAASAEHDPLPPHHRPSSPIGKSDINQKIDYTGDVIDPQSDIGQAILAGGVQPSLPTRRYDVDDSDDDDFPIHVDDFPSDDTFDEILDSGRKKEAKRASATAAESPKDPFEDDDLDTELMNIDPTTPARTDGQSPPFTQRTPPVPKLQWMPPTPYTSPTKQQTALSSPTTMATIHTSPVTPISKPHPLSERSPNVTSSPNLPPHILPTKDGRPIPFIRPPFPSPVLPRSHIPGPSPRTLLRTCFRIGEALNAASLALRNSQDAVIELYCRVKASEREGNGYKQSFELVDLFTPDKPPTLSGHYAIWKGVDLWDHDSKQFLGEGGKGRKARVLGRIRRGEKNVGWEMVILSVWQVDWEDVGVAKGVVCS